MALLRTAFEQDDGVTAIVVLCAGCFSEMSGRIPANRKRWSRPMDTGCCEFCLDEVRAEIAPQTRR